jgi:hypothetical protein
VQQHGLRPALVQLGRERPRPAPPPRARRAAPSRDANARTGHVLALQRPRQRAGMVRTPQVGPLHAHHPRAHRSPTPRIVSRQSLDHRGTRPRQHLSHQDLARYALSMAWASASRSPSNGTRPSLPEAIRSFMPVSALTSTGTPRAGPPPGRSRTRPRRPGARRAAHGAAGQRIAGADLLRGSRHRARSTKRRIPRRGAATSTGADRGGAASQQRRSATERP